MTFFLYFLVPKTKFHVALLYWGGGRNISNGLNSNWRRSITLEVSEKI